MPALFDTASLAVSELVLRESGRLSMYVCGPTVYELPHLGHGRALLVYDVLRRHLSASGFDVRLVSNVTDVDDKIIERASREGAAPADIAERYESLWWEASDALGVLRPDVAPRATAYVPAMVELVGELVAAGAAYEASDGVYLDTPAVGDYGLLKHQPLDQLRAGARVAGPSDKRSPLDFVLWKAAKPGEPLWASPWGEGRPGWHTECVVMALDLLGQGFDLHAGGMDLAFPHHENERAQAVALGRPFARRWMHHAFVTDHGGEKMSRSLGNFSTLPEMLEAGDARAYRLLVLQSQYRQPLEVTRETLAMAQESLGRLDNMARRLLPDGAAGAGVGADAGITSRFRRAMDDDLDTPAALAALFEGLRSANSAAAAGEGERAVSLAAAVAEACAWVGLDLQGSRAVPGWVSDAVTRRDEARRARDFAGADALRDRLAESGWMVEDGPGGTSVHRRPSR